MMKKTAAVMLLLLTAVSLVFPREVFMWIQYGKAAGDLTKSNFTKYPHIEKALTTIGLQFWNTESSGAIPYTVKENSAADVKYWTAWGHERKIKVFLTVSRFTTGLAHEWGSAVTGALTTNRSAYIANLMDTVEAYGLDGVDLDLEDAWGRTGASQMTTFLKEIKDSLNIRGKKLSVCIFAGDNPSFYNNFPQVYDSKNWSSYVDYVNVMGYQETSEGASSDSLTYTYILKTHRSKGFDSAAINLGLPAYVTQWGGKTPLANLKDINALGGSVCIWDSKLYNGGSPWTDATLWEELLKTKENGGYDWAKGYKVTVSSGAGGKVSPTGSVMVDSAKNQIFTITPDQYFLVDDITVDGVSKKSDLTGTGTTKTYTLNKVETEHSIDVSFRKDPEAPELFTITVMANANGTADPNGITTAAAKSTKSAAIKPNDGYVVDYVTVDGVKRGPIVSVSFKNILANHSVEAFFKKATGGDLGKYPAWNSSVLPTYKEKFTHNDSVWEYTGDSYGGSWGANLEPTIKMKDQYGTPPWTFVSVYNNTADTLITASLDYRSAADGSDTLVITTDTTVNKSIKSGTQTIILKGTPVSPVKSKTASLSVGRNGLSFTAPVSGIFSTAVYDLRGRELIRRTITAEAGKPVGTGIEAAVLPRGVYLLKIEGCSLTAIQKFER